MSKITSTRTINGDAHRIFELARQVERFPDVLPNIDRVTVLEEHGNGSLVTRWEGSFAVGPLKRQLGWTEEDHWDEANLLCTFKLVEGDMKVYEGTWRFTQQDDSCQVELAVDFELGIPLLGPMVNRIVDNLMQQNCDELLEALEKLLGSNQA